MESARAIASLVMPGLPVALARRRNPGLRGRPVAVARSGTVVAASGEARGEGVAPGLSAERARERAAVVPFDAGDVRRARRRVGERLSRYTPRVESEGDGAWYLDLTGTRRCWRRSGVDLLAEAIREVAADLDLSACAALATGKAVARMTAARAGEEVARVPAGEEAERIRDFPVAALPEADREQRHRLARLGLDRLGDVAAVAPVQLEAAFGRRGLLWSQWSRGMDPRPVSEWAAGPEATDWRLSLPLSEDQSSVTAAGPILLGAAERLGRRLRDRAERAVRLQLGIRHRDGVERARTARIEPADRDLELYEAFAALLEAAWTRRVALQRVTAAVLERAGGGQGELFADEEPLDRLQDSLDAVRDRFGAAAVHWGRSL